MEPKLYTRLLQPRGGELRDDLGQDHVRADLQGAEDALRPAPGQDQVRQLHHFSFS